MIEAKDIKKIVDDLTIIFLMLNMVMHQRRKETVEKVDRLR